jgi:hypothetical protein
MLPAVLWIETGFRKIRILAFEQLIDVPVWKLVGKVIARPHSRLVAGGLAFDSALFSVTVGLRILRLCHLCSLVAVMRYAANSLRALLASSLFFILCKRKVLGQ